MKRSHAIVAVVFAVAAALALPTAALAFQIRPGGGGTQTQNPYGLWYAGQEACAQEGCHSAIAANETVHGNMVTDVNAFPSKLVPDPNSSFWPFSSPFGGPVLRPRDMYLKIGDNFGFLEYVGSDTNPNVTGVVPADDIAVWGPMEYVFGANGTEGEWVAPSAAISASAYSQSCSACHNLGVTRPSDKSYVLPGVPSPQTTSTPSSVSAFSIQCEVCHGSGKTPDGHKKGVPAVVGGTQILKAQVCGQCHVGGTTVQKNVKGAAFGNPNGYTVDATLSAFFTPYTTVESTATFMDYIRNGGAKPKFLPNGADYSMRHTYYNEWLVNKVPSEFGGSKGHADPLNNAVLSAGDTKCLKCHSGLGFLNRIGSLGPSGKRIVPTFPTMSEVTTGDPGISCQVCHSGHVGYKPEGGYDSARRWANGREVSCGDCHNWQFEQMNQSVQNETLGGDELARPAVNSRVRHAQREMVSGGQGGDLGTAGMWGVEPMGEYMPGTRCQDCHMPRTHREGMPADDNGDAEGTRMSHRFHVVDPGDAIAWQLRPNGDSCLASCHKQDAARYDRADFQAWIDEKRSTVATASREATGELDVLAADFGLTGGWTDFIAAKPGTGPAAALSNAKWAMLQHAAQNVDFVLGDASGGIHNPDYAMAGLSKALLWAQSATVTVDAAIGDTPVLGSGANVKGWLTDAHGDSIPGADVALEVSDDGGLNWTQVDQAHSDASGGFEFATGVIRGELQLRCTFAPATGVSYSSTPIAVHLPVTACVLNPAAAGSAWVDASVANVTLTSAPGTLTFYTLAGASTKAQTLYTGPFAITAEGDTSIRFWSTTADGIEAPNAQGVYIDRGAPVVASDAMSVYTNSAVVRVSADDAGAGVATFSYSLDGGPTLTASDTWAVCTITSLGAHSISATAVDGAGKSSSKSWSFSVKTMPAVSTSPSGRSYRVRRGKTWTTKAKVTSGGSGIAGKSLVLQRSTNGRTWKNYATVVTKSSGQASRSIKMSSRGTWYWRWYSPETSSHFSAGGSKTKTVVR